MLHRVDTLLTYDLRSSEGKLGEVEDIYFDDRYWTVRYLVVETGGWLVQKRVLIAPQAIAFVDAQSKSVATELTKEQVENSPTPDEHAPVSRQFEMAYHDYYNYSPYWVGPMGESAYIPPLPPQDAAGLEEREEWDPHLYAVKDVSGSMGYT